MEGQENTGQQTKRAMLAERMRKKYPDLNVDDDEVMYGQMMTDYDDLENENKGYKEREKTLVDMYTADPKSAYFMEELRKGGDPLTMMVREFGDDLEEALHDPEKQEALAEAHKEYLERVAENGRLEQEFEKNMTSTLDYLRTLADEGKMEDEQIDDVMEHLFTIVHEGLTGKFSPETIEMVAKALKYDGDVQEAQAAGEVKGRNAKIDEKLRRANKGDGVSALNGKNGMTQERPRRRMSMFDLAKEA